MLATLLSAFSGLCSVVKGLLGLKRDAALKQSGADAQANADLTATVKVEQAEVTALERPSDAQADLAAGKFGQ